MCYSWTFDVIKCLIYSEYEKLYDANISIGVYLR